MSRSELSCALLILLLYSGFWSLASGFCRSVCHGLVRLLRYEKKSGVDEGQLVGWPDSDVMPGACDGRDERFNTLGRTELTNAKGMTCRTLRAPAGNEHACSGNRALSGSSELLAGR